MSRAGTSTDPAVTCSAAITSKELWDRYTTLIGNYFKSLEEWVKDRAYPNIEALTKSLQGNMSDPEQLWATMEALQIVTSDQLKYKTQLANIDKILTSMEDEVMSALAGLKPTDKDTYQDRDLLVREQRTIQEVALDAYTSWESRYKRLKADYESHTNSDGTPRTKAERDMPHRGRRRDRSLRLRSRSVSPRERHDRPKPVTDAKALKPAILETSMPPLSLIEWFK